VGGGGTVMGLVDWLTAGLVLRNYSHTKKIEKQLQRMSNKTIEGHIRIKVPDNMAAEFDPTTGHLVFRKK
jgi:hypothetical protein